MRIRVRALDLSAFEAAGVEGALAASRGGDLGALATELMARLGVEGCHPRAESFEALQRDHEWARFTWQVRCPDAASAPRVVSRLHELRPAHLHIARLPGGATVVLDAASPVAGGTAMTTGAARTTSFGASVRRGFEHVGSGPDHLLFLLLLLVVATSPKELAATATGFTVGHCVTLVAAARGWVEPTVSLVELMIAISIGVVALENVLVPQPGGAPIGPGSGRRVVLASSGTLLALTPVLGVAAVGLALFTFAYLSLVRRGTPRARARSLMACLFGLVHGFGFAGALSEAGPPPALVLAGFNVGVELAQLSVLAVGWLVVSEAAPRVGRRRIVIGASALGVGTAVHWTLSRLPL